MPEAAITLKAVAERLGRVEWTEAIAIAEGICAAAAAAGTGIPDLADIAIGSDGVVALQATDGAPPGPRLGRVLHGLTGSGQMPVPVRLFITKWIGCEEPHTLADVARDVAYFAHPDGATLVRAVYERAARTQAPAPAPMSSSPPEVILPRPRPQPRRSRRVRPLFAVAAVAALAAAITAVWAWRSPDASIETPAWLTTAVERTRELIARASEDATAASTTAAPAPATADARRAPSRRSRAPNAAAAKLTAMPAAVTVVAPAPVPPSSPLSVLSKLVPVVPEGPATPMADNSRPQAAFPAAAADEDPSRIYSSADAGVVPPRMRQPQLPPPLFVGSEPSLNTMELIVSETGSVERVRLLSAPRRMADMMMLSGAKAWVFEPASRDGEAVSYRLLLSWQPTP